MCKTSYVTYLSAHYNFWNVLKYIKKNKIQNTRLLILWTTMAAPSILGNTVWKPFSRSIGPSFPFTIPLLYDFPLQLSPSKKLHNLFIILQLSVWIYDICICDFYMSCSLAASNCDTTAWFYNWVKPTVMLNKYLLNEWIQQLLRLCSNLPLVSHMQWKQPERPPCWWSWWS